ncbi:ras guanine nucleotide exchange factor Q [Sitodiplosis mosellana]|uniref:ras guanine nucleotide exchange factor Q n=1 Tax=Sitodiplosis mosellana TaxID=263140 RepID=UPI002443B5F0|nr:ras guanine nucleotide exchange factor Q [Sitodiplosis mosellana]
MPIQLLLDWSKALVAIVCSLLLAISFIMCTAKPVAIVGGGGGLSTNDFTPANRTQLLKRNAIESENRLMLTTPSNDAMPLNISLSHNPFGLDTVKNDTSVVKWHVNATQPARTTKSTSTSAVNPSKNIRHGSISTTTTTPKVAITNHSSDASNELNLAALSGDGNQQPNNFEQLKVLARTQPNIKSNDQPVDTTKTSTNEQNATRHFSATKFNVFKLVGKKSPTRPSDGNFTTELPTKQTTTIHQSTITTKATIQSVFLDHLNNFNDTKSPNIDSISNDNINPNTQTQDMVDAEILSRTERSVQIAANKRKRLHNDSNNAERIERSANFSLSKATKRIQLLIKGRFLQMLPDGTVNGTQDDQSEYTILQRNTVDVGQIRLIGIATCLYLCMDSCGNLYSSREFTNDCIFNERLEDNYNYYTSTHHSSAWRTYYMALNRLGVPRKTHLPSNKPLGKLSTYVKAFTLTVPEHRSEAVIGKRFGFNHVTHGIKHLCESGKQLMELTQKQLVYPECQSGSSNGSINSSLSKKQQQQPQPNHHHIRHAMTHQHHRRPAPASLTDRGSNRKNAGSGTTVTKAVACNTEQCLKKKKANGNNGSRSGGNNNSNNSNSSNKRNNMKKLNAKSTKTRPNKKATTKMTTTTTTTTTTTESAILYGPTAGLDNVPDNYDDELDYSGSVQISSNSQTGLASDEDYEGDK